MLTGHHAPVPSREMQAWWRRAEWSCNGSTEPAPEEVLGTATTSLGTYVWARQGARYQLGWTSCPRIDDPRAPPTSVDLCTEVYPEELAPLVALLTVTRTRQGRWP